MFFWNHVSRTGFIYACQHCTHCVLTLRSSHLFTGHCLGTSRVTWLMIAGSSPTPEPDDCAQLTPEHWPSVALRVLSATEHLLPRHHGCGTVCHPSCDNPNCHMDNLGVRLRHFYLGSRVTGAVWPLLTAPYKNTYLQLYPAPPCLMRLLALSTDILMKTWTFS